MTIIASVKKNIFYFIVRTVHIVQFIYPDQQMHNIYINNIVYTVSTPTCFNASASSSGRLNLAFCWCYKIIKITAK